MGFKANHSSSSVILVLFDLSAAFDTIDSDILVSCLKKMVGIWGKALEWFKSFLSNRSFSDNFGQHLFHCIVVFPKDLFLAHSCFHYICYHHY